MGILNCTPDSFSDGGDYYKNPQKAAERACQMRNEGADIIDIGGESTRPGSEFVSGQEEADRIIPVVREVRRMGDTGVISVDTYKSEVAKAALEAGADMVNSLGGFLFDPVMADVVSAYASPIIIYHIKGTPKTMQKGTITYKNIVKEIGNFFTDQINFGITKGIKREKFLIDPGIGFGKTLEQNIEISKRLSEFQTFSLPMVIGISRKSHLGVLLQQKLSLPNIPLPAERLEAALAETAIAVLHGAKIVRTHDVWQTKKFLTVLDRLR